MRDRSVAITGSVVLTAPLRSRDRRASGVEAPRDGVPIQVMGAVVGKGKLRTRDQIGDGTRNDDLARYADHNSPEVTI